MMNWSVVPSKTGKLIFRLVPYFAGFNECVIKETGRCSTEQARTIACYHDHDEKVIFRVVNPGIVFRALRPIITVLQILRSRRVPGRYYRYRYQMSEILTCAYSLELSGSGHLSK
jgi:hypothetical protein